MEQIFIFIFQLSFLFYTKKVNFKDSHDNGSYNRKTLS